MKLQEEGRLSLNDKVFGPDGILNDPYFSDTKRQESIRNYSCSFLSHEAGWTQRYGDQMFMPILIAEKMGVKPPVDTKTIVRFALDKRVAFYSRNGSGILKSGIQYTWTGN